MDEPGILSDGLWLVSMALGRDVGSSPLWSIRAGPELYLYSSQFLEVPTPSRLLSSLSGMDRVISLLISVSLDT